MTVDEEMVLGSDEEVREFLEAYQKVKEDGIDINDGYKLFKK